jgi:very-short-patch-repair endonuclease
LPAVYDTVIIDEASQCDVPPMIPALYRAKTAVIVGDPQQFPPVVTMRVARNEYLLRQNQLKDVKYAMYNYCQASAYSVVGEKRIMLTNHYRCHPDIAEYFNDAFYNNRLNVCTSMEGLSSPSAYGLKHAVDWVNVNNSIESEIDAVVDRVALLARTGYSGSVGVVTPLRKYANILDEKLNRYRHSFKDELIVNTVNAFQGGEKDVIIFMLSYTSDLAKTQNWYITSESNRYIYNVAVSRARACLVLVGDKSRCAESDCTLLRKLAALPIEKKKNSDAPRFDSVWEERFYNALVQVGIVPQTQYHLVGRRLDMAVITDSVKLDIEVDGVRWHTSASGGRKTDDLWRDMQVTSAGCKVLRFWVYELEQDMQACVEVVKNALKQS